MITGHGAGMEQATMHALISPNGTLIEGQALTLHP